MLLRGMQTMEQSLADLALKRVITVGAAFSRTSHPEQLRGRLNQHGGVHTDGHKSRTRVQVASRQEGISAQHASGFSGVAHGLDPLGDGVLHLRIGGTSQHAERCGQIGGAKEDPVNPLGGGNVRKILQARDGFHLDQYTQFACAQSRR